MNYDGLSTVGGGAATDASLRWKLGSLLNLVFPTLPIGTLAANLLAGFLMGVAVKFLAGFLGWLVFIIGPFLGFSDAKRKRKQ